MCFDCPIGERLESEGYTVAFASCPLCVGAAGDAGVRLLLGRRLEPLGLRRTHLAMSFMGWRYESKLLFYGFVAFLLFPSFPCGAQLSSVLV